jgi:hypothetical protein
MILKEMRDEMIKKEDVIIRQFLQLNVTTFLNDDSYFPPPWNPNEFPEKTEGWIEFQKYMRKEPEYYKFDDK